MRIVAAFDITGRVANGAFIGSISISKRMCEHQERGIRSKRSGLSYIRCPFLSLGVTILEGGEPAGDCPSSSGEGAISIPYKVVRT